MGKNILLFTTAFLLGISATGLGQTEPTFEETHRVRFARPLWKAV
jgi:hypothetical protein